MVAMVGISFHHSGILSIPDCQPCFHCTESSRPSPSCRWEDAAGPLLILPIAKSRPGLCLCRQEAQCRKIRGTRGAGIHEFNLGVGRIGHKFVVADAKGLVASMSQFRMRAVRNGDSEPDSEAGDRILTQYRRGEDGNRYNAAKDDKSKPGAGDETDAREGIAAAAKAATLAAEASTEEFVEKFEDSLGMDRTRTKPGNPEIPEDDRSGLQDERFLRTAAAAENADAVLALIAERVSGRGGCLSNELCSQLIFAATSQNNAELAFSIMNSMRNSLRQRRIDQQEDASGGGGRNGGWRWPQPDVTNYAALVRGLAASLRVSDAIQTVADVRRRGVPQGDEVPFGKLVNCPMCKTSLAVVQPQHGVQLVPCATCRYKYELVSGDIVSSASESMSSNASFWDKCLQVLPFWDRRIPAAVHSIEVRAPDGLARTYRFATKSADVPAQEGERVTMVLASPAVAGRKVGPIDFNARAPGWQPREPMTVTNHVTGKVLSLKRAPPEAGKGARFGTSMILPIALLLATTDAASGLIDPSLPRLITVGAAAAVTLGVAANTLLLPRLKKLSQRTVDAVALRQRLLAQYEQLQARLQELTESASDEVRMLARMCQLQNKMEAVGEASYSARIERVQKARDGLDERLIARLELMDSYAKVASMIEIEVEMDIDVLAAEAASPDATIAEQIESLMEVESLQKEWKNQAEANDEVERLLRSSPLLPDSA